MYDIPCKQPKQLSSINHKSIPCPRVDTAKYSKPSSEVIQPTYMAQPALPTDHRYPTRSKIARAANILQLEQL